MRKQQNKTFLHLMILVTTTLGLLVSCKNEKPEPYQAPEPQQKLIPQPFPTTYGFPVSEATLIGYTQDYTNPKNIEGIYTHAWQIWAGLTQMTDLETENGHKIRVFESWRTPQQIKSEDRINDKNLFPLTVPHQLGHGVGLDSINETQLAGFVKYSPAAEKHVVEQGIFDQKVAKSLIKSGANQIIGFPVKSIMIKPVFLPVNLANGKDTIHVWQGPPKDTIRTWDQNDWPNSLIKVVKSKSEADGKTKFAISDFINFKVDKNFTEPFGNFEHGDYAVLVGMHVMTKETTRWTWQSFWWSQYPDTPHFPSSKLHASYRSNVTLDDAASHYAMTAAYSTKIPAQPYINGQNIGESLYAYNPYLEAGFGPSGSNNPVLLGENESGIYNGKTVQNNYGIQTNCMSCHIQARWPQNNSSLNYNGNRYVDFQQSYGKDTLQLDFLWSVNATLGSIK
ncbi:hypothetical protein [Aquimarina algiphila]|uniref:hypothetical protein n=1 Tax=Aquimarina algiphila TaxID=2047982 RepID=UPI0023308DEB|nr:hypothetical protein [Aquimarina algiphila]